MSLTNKQEDKIKKIDRRELLKKVTIASVAVVGTTLARPLTKLKAKEKQSLSIALEPNRVVDLSHTLFPNFPTFSGKKWLEIENIYSFKKDGYNLNRWSLVEHIGTHIDAPAHFSNNITVEKIEPQNLVGPLAVVDIQEKAEKNPDARLTTADLKKWEKQNGRLPHGAIVALNSGWDKYVKTPKFRNADSSGKLHFPGFHIEAINFLLAERNVKGLLVDTLSLDYGLSPDYAVHNKWLPAGHWGVEVVKNLGKLPARGATVVVGAPTIQGGSGGPSRVLAFV